MKEYNKIIIKVVVIIVLIIALNILISDINKVYIPDYEVGLPKNTYYTEEDFGYETLYMDNFLNNFITNLYDKDYENAYEVLSDKTKRDTFTNVSKFKEYIEKYFDGIINAKSIDDIYTVELDYKELEDYKKIDYFFNSNENNKNEKPGLKISIIEKGPYDIKIEI